MIFSYHKLSTLPALSCVMSIA